MSAPAPPEDPAVASIKATIVFEKMIASILAAAALAALIGFAVRIGGGLGAAALSGATFALLFFFAAFGSAVAVGVPLYLHLEKLKIRKAWPYALAAAIAGLGILSAMKAAPAFEAPWRALYIVPGVAAALLFARKMRPFWLAAERADAPSPPAVLRLH